MLPMSLLATMKYDWMFLEPYIGGKADERYVSSPVAKTLVLDWKILIGTTVFGCLCDSLWGEPLLDPKKLQNQQFYIIDWIRKNLLVDVANLATCYYDDYDVPLEVWEPCANAMLVVLLPKLWFWIENHDWHNCFWMSSWGSPLLGPKKLQNQQFYIIDWIRKKLLVDVANLATCCHDDLWCTIGCFGNPAQMLC